MPARPRFVSVLLLTALATVAWSCGDDDDEPVASPEACAAATAAGEAADEFEDLEPGDLAALDPAELRADLDQLSTAMADLTAAVGDTEAVEQIGFDLEALEQAIPTEDDGFTNRQTTILVRDAISTLVFDSRQLINDTEAACQEG